MNAVVLGLGFGDEGKGATVNAICQELKGNTLVVRFCGGHQAGHTVVSNGVRHVFSNFGSGTIQGAPTYWSKYCTVDPVGIYNEYQILKEKSIEPKLYIDAECPITTPFEKLANRRNRKLYQNGTCGVGFGETIQREEDHYHLRFSDIYYPSIFEIKMNLLEKRFGLGHRAPFLNNERVEFERACSFLIDKHFKVIHLANKQIINRGQFSHIIFEGAQGLLLDQHMGFFPHVTRSNTGTKNIISILDKCNQIKDLNDYMFFLVTRPYQTRHGAGPMTNEHIDISSMINDNSNETNKEHRYQGEFRRTMLDSDLLEYACQYDKGIIKDNSILVVTCLEQMKKFMFTGGINKIKCSKEDFMKRLAVRLGTHSWIGIKNNKFDRKFNRKFE